MIKTELSRKNFLRTLLSAIGAYLFSGVLFPPGKSIVYSATQSEGRTIHVIKGSNIKRETVEKMARAGFESMGGIGRFVKKGMNVVIKPNIGWSSSPERAHTTNPDLVRAVAKMCVERGAKVKIFDRTCNNAQMCYKKSGIMAAAKEAGADIEYYDERNHVEVPVRKGLNLKTLKVYRDIRKADFIINMPIAKDHSAATLTMAMKNLMGVIGGNRGWFHLNLHKNIVDFNKAIPVNINIIDATRILTDHGPAGGSSADIRHPRTLVFGTNPVSVDAFTAETFFNIKPESIDYLKYAADEGMGVIQTGKLKIIRKSV